MRGFWEACKDKTDYFGKSSIFQPPCPITESNFSYQRNIEKSCIMVFCFKDWHWIQWSFVGILQKNRDRKMIVLGTNHPRTPPHSRFVLCSEKFNPFFLYIWSCYKGPSLPRINRLKKCHFQSCLKGITKAYSFAQKPSYCYCKRTVTVSILLSRCKKTSEQWIIYL